MYLMKTNYLKITQKNLLSCPEVVTAIKSVACCNVLFRAVHKHTMNVNITSVMLGAGVLLLRRGTRRGLLIIAANQPELAKSKQLFTFLPKQTE